MTPKLTTGDTLTNLKYYMFITNEYGKPTEGSIDLFIESFGAIILNGNFSRYINETVEKDLNNWWSEIQQDLEERGLQSLAKYNSGFEWFKQIAKEGKQLSSIDELREYILSEKCNMEFKKYLTDKNSDTQEENEITASEIQDNTIYEVSSTEINTEKTIDSSETSIKDNDRLVIKLGKTIELTSEFPSDIEVHEDEYGKFIYTKMFINRGSIVNTIKLYDTGYCIFLPNQKVAEAYGEKVIECRNKWGISIEEHIETQEIWCNSYNYLTHRIVGPNNDSYGVHMGSCRDDKNRNIAYLFRRKEVKEIKKENKYHYKLLDNTYINHMLTITEQVDDISTTYKARIINDIAVELEGNKITNINELIEDAENRNVNINIKMGFFRFEFLYAEEEQDG